MIAVLIHVCFYAMHVCTELRWQERAQKLCSATLIFVIEKSFRIDDLKQNPLAMSLG